MSDPGSYHISEGTDRRGQVTDNFLRNRFVFFFEQERSASKMTQRLMTGDWMMVVALIVRRGRITLGEMLI